jgi:hypothetical protein
MIQMTRYLAALAVMAILLAACPQDAAVQTEEDNGEQPPAQQEGEEIEIAMVAQNDSGQDGTATLTEVPTEEFDVRVVVELNNPSEGVNIYIHRGTCADLGSIQEDIGPLVDGRAEGPSFTGLAELLDGEFAINARKSPEAINVSCGDIEE